MQRGLSLRFNGYFPGEHGLASVYWSKGWWRWWGGDNWTTGAISPVKSSSPTNQHRVFLRVGCPSCRPTNSDKALKGVCRMRRLSQNEPECFLDNASAVLEFVETVPVQRLWAADDRQNLGACFLLYVMMFCQHQKTPRHSHCRRLTHTHTYSPNWSITKNFQDLSRTFSDISQCFQVPIKIFFRAWMTTSNIGIQVVLTNKILSTF